MDLSIPIPKQTRTVGLTDCLSAFVTEESMEKCGYRCARCKREDNFTKQLTVQRFPQVLVIHLKRFKVDFTKREKLNTGVNIPLTVDMAPYAPYSKDASKSNANYELYGISHHSGSLSGGHYIADVKTTDGSWFRCNDSMISKIS